jgi:hypothetical protein
MLRLRQARADASRIQPHDSRADVKVRPPVVMRAGPILLRFPALALS